MFKTIEITNPTLTEGHQEWEAQLAKAGIDKDNSPSTGHKIGVSLDTPLIHEGHPFELRLVDHIDRQGKVFRSNPNFPYKYQGQWAMWVIDEGTALMLTGLVAALQPRVILETGTNRGRATLALAEGVAQCHDPGMIHTVDIVDHNIFESGAVPEHLQPYITCIIAKEQDAFTQPPLKDLEGIEFAFLDADHSAEGVEGELKYLESHRADKCTVVVDNTDDDFWHVLRDLFKDYDNYPCVTLPTMSGLTIIQMDLDGKYD